MKKTALFAALLLSVAMAAGAQQITRVGVVDLQKIYMTYYKDSDAVRAFEEEKLRVQNEIKRLRDEITELQRRRLERQAAGDSAAVKALDESIYSKAQYLSDYAKMKQADLDAKAEALTKSDAFAQMLYRAVQSISELEGYSLVISSKNADGSGSSIVWYSPMIDITDKVIQALLGS